MIRASLALALLAASTATAAQDNRIVERFYDAGKVVRIDGKAKVQATIQFAEDERIENVAIGDSEAWQVTAELHDHVDNPRCIGDRIAAGQANPRLHDHQRQLLQRSAQGVGVNGGKASRMAGVDRPQEADALRPAKLAQNDAIRA